MFHICLNCNSSFIKRSDSKGIFCSKSCNAKYHNVRRTKKIKQTIECLSCKTPITLPNKFCGHSCAAIYNNALRPKKSKISICAHCGNKFTGKRKFCSRRCGWDAKKKNITIEERKAGARETYKRYIARRKYQTPIDENIKALKEFYLNCPPGYEVDHIIPLSKGGSHTLKNLQYLTKEENRKKSNKILAGVGIEPT